MYKRLKEINDYEEQRLNIQGNQYNKENYCSIQWGKAWAKQKAGKKQQGLLKHKDIQHIKKK